MFGDYSFLRCPATYSAFNLATSDSGGHEMSDDHLDDIEQTRRWQKDAAEKGEILRVADAELILGRLTESEREALVGDGNEQDAPASPPNKPQTAVKKLLGQIRQIEPRIWEVSGYWCRFVQRAMDSTAVVHMLKDRAIPSGTPVFLAPTSSAAIRWRIGR